MFIGGIRALLLQSLHPLAMAAVAGHSGFRGDPWGRLQRTSYFLAVTTFGPAERRAGGDRPGAGDPPAGHRDRARRAAICGLRPAPADAGCTWPRPTASCAPHTALRHPAASTRPRRTSYVEPTWPGSARRSACTTRRAPRPSCRRARRATGPSWQGTAAAREAARFLLLSPPLPLVARARLRRAGRGRRCRSLPGWARRPLYLPRLPVTEVAVVRPAGHAMVHAIRWATTAPSAATAS